MTGNLSNEDLLELFQIRLATYLAGDNDKNWPEAREITIEHYKNVIAKLKKDIKNES